LAKATDFAKKNKNGEKSPKKYAAQKMSRLSRPAKPLKIIIL